MCMGSAESPKAQNGAGWGGGVFWPGEAMTSRSTWHNDWSPSSPLPDPLSPPPHPLYPLLIPQLPRGSSFSTYLNFHPWPILFIQTPANLLSTISSRLLPILSILFASFVQRTYLPFVLCKKKNIIPFLPFFGGGGVGEQGVPKYHISLKREETLVWTSVSSYGFNYPIQEDIIL